MNVKRSNNRLELLASAVSAKHLVAAAAAHRDLLARHVRSNVNMSHEQIVALGGSGFAMEEHPPSRLHPQLPHSVG